MQAQCASWAIPPPAGCEIRTKPKKMRKNKQFRRARSLKLRAWLFSRLKNLMKHYPRLKAPAVSVQKILMRLMSRMRCDLMLDLRFVDIHPEHGVCTSGNRFSSLRTWCQCTRSLQVRGAWRSCVPAVSRVWFPRDTKTST